MYHLLYGGVDVSRHVCGCTPLSIRATVCRVLFSRSVCACLLFDVSASVARIHISIFTYVHRLLHALHSRVRGIPADEHRFNNRCPVQQQHTHISMSSMIQSSASEPTRREAHGLETRKQRHEDEQGDRGRNRYSDRDRHAQTDENAGTHTHVYTCTVIQFHSAVHGAVTNTMDAAHDARKFCLIR